MVKGLPVEILHEVEYIIKKHIQNVLEIERYRIYDQIELLKVRKDLPKEPDRILNMAKAIVLNPALTIQDLFDMMEINIK